MELKDNLLNIEKLNNLLNENRYDEALELLNSIKWNTSKDIELLKTVAKVYEKAKKFDECKSVLKYACKYSTLKHSFYKQLIKVCIEDKDISQAKSFLEQFRNCNVKDIEVDYFEYLILSELSYSSDELISILERIQKTYYKEEWMLSLAKEYEKAGFIEKCIAQCDEIYLWFGDGKFVAEALCLKEKYRPLTLPEKEKLSKYLDNNKDELVVEEKLDKNLNILRTEDYDIKIYKNTGSISQVNKSEDIIDNLLKSIDDEEVSDVGIKDIKLVDIGNKVFEDKAIDLCDNSELNDNINDSINDEYIYDDTLEEDYELNEQEDDYDLTEEELAEILAGEEEYKQELVKNAESMTISETNSLSRKISRLNSYVVELDIANEKYLGKKHIILSADSKDLSEEFAITYSRYRGNLLGKKVSIISAEKLNNIDIKEIYSKIPNRFLIIKNSELLTDSTYSNIVKASNYNNDTTLIFTTDNINELKTLKEHLIQKLIAVSLEIDTLIDDYITYAVLYAAMKGYNLTDYAVEILDANSDEIMAKGDSYIFYEKVINCAIVKYKQRIDDNVLIGISNANIDNNNLLDDDIIADAIQELMDRNII